VTEADAELAPHQLDKVLASEVLAKSETSRKLLSYLVGRALRGETPKETEIAFDVFGKDPSFNGAEHSIVRVSVRTLRQKLSEYYAGPGNTDELRFDIPKGAYRVAVVRHEAAAAPAPVSPDETPPVNIVSSRSWKWPGSRPGNGPSGQRRWQALALGALVVLAASAILNVYLWSRPGTVAAIADPSLAQVRASGLWSDMVKSNRPVTVILGDLFMYTQVDSMTGRTLFVRDSSINSSDELRVLLANNPSYATERGQSYLTMVQKAVAIGMAAVLRVIDRPGRRIEVVAQDDVTADTVRNNDIIYLGPLARLGPLGSHYALQSRYRYSSEGSIITDVSTGKTFAPEGALNSEHMDYALASKFVGPTGNQMMIFSAGARNAGVLQIVRTVTSPDGVAQIDKQFLTHTPAAGSSFEALLTVTGFKQTDLAAKVVDVTPMPAPAPIARHQTAAGSTAQR
jgi:hypothetical protein